MPFHHNLAGSELHETKVTLLAGSPITLSTVASVAGVVSFDTTTGIFYRALSVTPGDWEMVPTGGLKTATTIVSIEGAAAPSAGQVLKATGPSAATWQNDDAGSSAADSLNTTTSPVVVNGATAPSSGQVLTATSATAANWQTPSSGGSSAGIAGTVQYSDGASGFSGDASNYWFNSTTKQLVIGGGTPDASAILDLTSTARGFLMPRMSTTDKGNISSPAAGLQVFDTWEESPYVNTSSFGWLRLAASGATNGAVQFSNNRNFGSDTAFTWDNSNKRLGVGTSSPSSKIDVFADSSNDRSISNTVYSASNSQGPSFRGRRALGTGTPAQVTAGTLLANFNGAGFTDSASFGGPVGGMYVAAAESFTATAQGTILQLYTTPTGSTTTAVRLHITNSGNVCINATAPVGSEMLYVNGAVNATGYSTNGNVGVSSGGSILLSSITNITIENGLITAYS